MRNKNVVTESRKKSMLAYVQKNYADILKYNSEYKNKKRKENPLYNEEMNIRNNINYYLSNDRPWKEGSLASKMVGMPYHDYIAYLESQFEEGMSWENYGKNSGCWSIAHTFAPSRAKSMEELHSLFIWKNTKPLWTIQNIKDSNW